MGWAVGEVAAFARVSVRTLHHYDELGLVVPSERTAAGHRRYSEADLDRLQQVVGYRALGLSLERIAGLLRAPGNDAVEHLRHQHSALLQRADDVRRQIAGVEKTMEAYAMGIRLTPAEMAEVFGDEDPAKHQAEVEERWGGTAAYAESQRRTSSYGKRDWQRMKDEAEALELRYAELFRDGAPASGAEAMDTAEAHRRHITAWFYDCPPAMHRGLGEMYIADERFAAHYDRRAAGLSAYVRDAVCANADRQEGAGAQAG